MDNTTAALLDVHRHSAWANQQLLTAAANLTPEEFRTPLGEGSIGDLLETLIHMYDAQLAWYDRARTGASGPSQTPLDCRISFRSGPLGPGRMRWTNGRAN